MFQYWYGQSMKGGHMRRKVLMFSLAFVVAGAVAVGVVGGIPAKADNQKVAQEELFPSETIKDNGDNEYVKLNNILVKAVEDYQNDKISKEEYESICSEVYSKIDTKQEEKNIKQQEKEYRESINK